MPRGSLPNGAGLQFSTDPAMLGQNTRAAAVIWQWQGVRHSVTVWPPVDATGTPQADPSAGVIGARAAGRDRAPGAGRRGRVRGRRRERCIGGAAPAGSVPGAVLFAAVLAAAVVLAGSEADAASPWRGVAVGVGRRGGAGGAVAGRA